MIQCDLTPVGPSEITIKDAICEQIDSYIDMYLKNTTPFMIMQFNPILFYKLNSYQYQTKGIFAFFFTLKKMC